jgi:hypothetical protein
LTQNIIDKLFENEGYIEGFCDSILLKLNEFYICKLLENVAEPTVEPLRLNFVGYGLKF